MRFIATEFRVDGEFGIILNVPNWSEADRVCVENGWRLDGEIAAIIPASDKFGHQQADKMISDLTESNEALKH